jgi:hypothetical protein
MRSGRKRTPFESFVRRQSGERLRGGFLCARAQIRDAGTNDGRNGGVQVFERECFVCSASVERSAGFQAVGDIDDRIEPRHVGRPERVPPNRLQNALVVDSETFAREFGAEPRVQNDRVAPLERVDRHIARFAFPYETLDRIEAREIVQHPGKPRAARIFAVPLCEPVGEARHTHRVRVAVRLTEFGSRTRREFSPVRDYRSPVERDDSSRSSTASRLRYNSPRKFPAHMTTAFSPLSL